MSSDASDVLIVGDRPWGGRCAKAPPTASYEGRTHRWDPGEGHREGPHVTRRSATDV